MDHYEVAIIGGGVHGSSAAFHLATLGVRTALFERGDAAGGPTGRSSAVCRAYYTNPFLARVARESLDLLADFAANTDGADAGFHRTGALFLHGPDDVEVVRETAERLNAIGTRTDVLDRDQLADEFPRFDLHGVACAAWEHGAGHADPVSTTVGLLGQAHRLGADVRLRTSVERLEHRPAAGGAVLHLGDGSTVTADRLLLAAGPWTRALAAQVGVTLPLTVERHVVATCSWGGCEPIPFAFADVLNGLYARAELGDQFLMGSLEPEPAPTDPDRFDERVGDREAMELVRRAVARIPSLQDVRPRGGWASLYDVSPDWQPVIGEIAAGVFVDAGTSGHGFKLAPGLGRHVADLVLGEPDPELAQFSPARFQTGATITGGYGEARILG